MLAVCLVVLMLAVAVVLDRLWVDSAYSELTAASEAAALAAARSLVNDDLLRPGVPAQRRIAMARLAAQEAAARNVVAGRNVALTITGSDPDVRIGVRAVSSSTGESRFLETDRAPNAVHVDARLERSKGNPVGMLMRGLTGEPVADVAMPAEALADNHVAGLQPTPGFAAPAFPLGILAYDPTGRRQDTWLTQILQRKGQDQFGYDEETGTVTKGPDGIPEILLRAADRNDRSGEPNMMLLDFGTGMRGQPVIQQILSGLTVDDLSRFPGGLLPVNPKLTLMSSSGISESQLNAFTKMVGECRACVLYLEVAKPGGQADSDHAQCFALAAGRVMQVIRTPGKAPQMVFQPGILVTRTALLAGNAGAPASVPPHNYLFKISLTQ